MSPPQARSTGLHGLEDAEIVVEAVMDNGARRDGVENRRKLAAASFQEGELYMHTGQLAKGEQPTIASHRIASHRTVLHCIALHCIAAAAPSVTRFGLPPPPPPPPTGPTPPAYPSPHPHTLAARKSFSAALTMSLILMQLVVSKLQEMLPRKSKVPRFET